MYILITLEGKEGTQNVMFVDPALELDIPYLISIWNNFFQNFRCFFIKKNQYICFTLFVFNSRNQWYCHSSFWGQERNEFTSAPNNAKRVWLARGQSIIIEERDEILMVAIDDDCENVVNFWQGPHNLHLPWAA